MNVGVIGKVLSKLNTFLNLYFLFPPPFESCRWLQARIRPAAQLAGDFGSEQD